MKYCCYVVYTVCTVFHVGRKEFGGIQYEIQDNAAYFQNDHKYFSFPKVSHFIECICHFIFFK